LELTAFPGIEGATLVVDLVEEIGLSPTPGRSGLLVVTGGGVVVAGTAVAGAAWLVG
jgi:hypothetical protein